MGGVGVWTKADWYSRLGRFPHRAPYFNRYFWAGPGFTLQVLGHCAAAGRNALWAFRYNP